MPARSRPLAARKVLALFDRAALRDFIDVANLAERYGKETLLGLAQRIDSGFDREVFCQMVQSLDRFTDEQIGSLRSEPAAMRQCYADWILELC